MRFYFHEDAEFEFDKTIEYKEKKKIVEAKLILSLPGFLRIINKPHKIIIQNLI